MSIGNEPLDIRSLSRVLASVYNWETLGINLGIQMARLQEIRQLCSGDLEMCKNRLYDLWLRQNTSPTWRDVVDALEQMEENSLADKIQCIYLHPFKGGELQSIIKLFSLLGMIEFSNSYPRISLAVKICSFIQMVIIFTLSCIRHQ